MIKTKKTLYIFLSVIRWLSFAVAFLFWIILVVTDSPMLIDVVDEIFLIFIGAPLLIMAIATSLYLRYAKRNALYVKYTESNGVLPVKVHPSEGVTVSGVVILSAITIPLLLISFYWLFQNL